MKFYLFLFNLLFSSVLLADKIPNPKKIPLQEIRIFAEVFERIKTNYVEEVDDKTLIENAIKGMLSALDPHSAFLVGEDYSELQEGTTGEFGGLGIEVGYKDGFLKVISPIDDTPAEKAGIKSGDIIVKIDNKSLRGMGMSDAVTLLRGKVGSKIKLTIFRKGNDKPLIFDIERAIIKISSVKRRLLEADFGYIRLSQFQTHTTKDMLKALNKLQKKNARPLKGLILDLRNNPGGVLSAAVGIVDAFVKEGLIVYTKGRTANSNIKYHATGSDVLNGAPLVVLINGGSASASEVVSGALQDHHRAIIMGSKSFGKGSVQSVISLKGNKAVKFTTARYYTPLGRSIQAKGIEPDVKLAAVKLEKKDTKHEYSVSEADLKNHIKNTDKDESSLAPTKNKSSLAEEDYAINEALNLLKGLVVLKK